eukprot:888866-Rhodomonas_salina.5
MLLLAWVVLSWYHLTLCSYTPLLYTTLLYAVQLDCILLATSTVLPDLYCRAAVLLPAAGTNLPTRLYQERGLLADL